MINPRCNNILPLLAGFLIVACCKGAFATTVILPADDEMVVESRAIVTGKVIGLSTDVDTNNDLVYTYIHLHVSTVLKGAITEREIVLKELGGETPEHGTQIFGMPRFEFGQEVFLYLNTWPDGALRVHQGFLGKFNITRDISTGRKFVERQVEGDTVAIKSTNNGTNASELGAYTQMVGRLIEGNRKRIRDFDRMYFSQVPLLASPTEFQSPGPGGEVSTQWSLLNPSSPARWFEADSNSPVFFYVNPVGAPSLLSLQEDMEAAMNAWSNAGGSLRVTYGGTTAGCGIQIADGLNTISFNNCDNYFSPSQGCSGLLAVSGIVRYIPSQTKTIGGTTYGKAVESNIAFNPFGLCQFTNRCQMQEVLTHEMGHALGLGHSSDSTATMTAIAHFDNRCAYVAPDDIRGITSVYPGDSTGGGLPAITGVTYKKKKVFVSGTGFQAGAVVYVDGQGLDATLDGAMLITQKRKQKFGTHQIYVINPDGSRSNTGQFVVE